MSFTAKRYDIDICPNQGLRVAQCGWQKCDSNHHCGPKIYNHFSITFILRGRGYYTLSGKTYDLHAGEGFIMTPGIINYYIADKDEPWEYIYAIFYGPDAPVLLRSAGLDEKNVIFQYPNDIHMRSCLNDMIQASKTGELKGYNVIGYLYLCLCPLIQAYSKQRTEQYPHGQYVAESIAYMETNYPYDISVADVAQYVGVERSYLYRLFKNQKGCSPRIWLIRYRLQRAIEMMEQTSLSITEIACSVGFYDVSHFSKSFSHTYHYSPSLYKKRLSKDQLPL